MPAAERDAKRKACLRELGFTSATEIDSRQGFDDVKDQLSHLANRVSNQPADAGTRRRLLAKIGELLADAEDAGYSGQVHRILTDRFKIIEGIRTIADLPTVELTQLISTLKARLRTWKQRQRPGTAPASDVQNSFQPLENGSQDQFTALNDANPAREGLLFIAS